MSLISNRSASDHRAVLFLAVGLLVSAVVSGVAPAIFQTTRPTDTQTLANAPARNLGWPFFGRDSMQTDTQVATR
jgi:hypothetical protein